MLNARTSSTDRRDAKAEGLSRAREVRAEWGNREQPIPDLFEEIRSRYGIWVVRRAFDLPIHGALLKHAGSGVIFVNTRARYMTAQRRTAAHELGHWLFGSGAIAEQTAADESAPGSSVGGFDEELAEWFAAEVLIPEAGIHSWLTGQTTTGSPLRASHVAQLAAHFRASYELAVHRLFELKVISPAQRTDLLNATKLTAAAEGGVITWYRQNVEAANDSLDLPLAYLRDARSAFVEELITLDRLAELEFRSVTQLKADPNVKELFEPNAEEETVAVAENQTPREARSATRTKKPKAKGRAAS